MRKYAIFALILVVMLLFSYCLAENQNNDDELLIEDEVVDLDDASEPLQNTVAPQQHVIISTSTGDPVLSIADGKMYVFGADFYNSTYLQMIDVFVAHGWSSDDIQDRNSIGWAQSQGLTHFFMLKSDSSDISNVWFAFNQDNKLADGFRVYLPGSSDTFNQLTNGLSACCDNVVHADQKDYFLQFDGDNGKVRYSTTWEERDIYSFGPYEVVVFTTNNYPYKSLSTGNGPIVVETHYVGKQPILDASGYIMLWLGNPQDSRFQNFIREYAEKHPDNGTSSKLDKQRVVSGANPTPVPTATVTPQVTVMPTPSPVPTSTPQPDDGTPKLVFTTGEISVATSQRVNIPYEIKNVPKWKNMKVKWHTEDTYYASVSGNRLSGKHPGTTTLTGTVKLKDGTVLEASCNVTIFIPVKSMKATNPKIVITAGQSYDAGDEISIKPEDASNRALSWSSSDESIATVSGNGYITAHKKGKCTIIATTTDGSKKTAKIQVTVDPKNPVSVKHLKRNIGRSFEFDVTNNCSSRTITKIEFSYRFYFADGSVKKPDISALDCSIKKQKSITVKLTYSESTLLLNQVQFIVTRVEYSDGTYDSFTQDNCYRKTLSF